MWPLVTIIVCVVVIVAYAIYKLSRENAESQTFAEVTTSIEAAPIPQDAPATHQSKDFHFYDLLRSVFQDEHGSPDHEKHWLGFNADQMIPVATIISAVEQFKANYRGTNREQLMPVVDNAVSELKSRFGDAISVRDLREFIASQRQRLFRQ
jgi:hypothetical protein